jgi:zinc/manganese transport system ATP-binding protein
MAAASAVLTLQGVTVERGGRVVLDDVGGTVTRGALTAIVGPNGAGKSTLLDVLAGRLAPTQGRVATGAVARTACLPQQSGIDRSFPIRVGDVVALGAWSRIGLWRALGGALRREVADALATVGLAGFERRLIAELSAGQFQRVLFARLLLQDADLILLDEPFNAIDERTTADLLALIRRWQAEGRSVVAVLHDLEQVRAHFDQTLLLARRVVAWGPTAAVLRPEHLRVARLGAEAWA